MEKFISDYPKDTMKELVVSPDCYAVKKKIVDLHFPRNTIIAIIKRNGQFITPSGSTVIEANDVLVVLADKTENLKKVQDCLKTGEYN